MRPRSDCSSLFFYQKSQCLYLLTFDFVQRFIQNNDRTRDQMLQAARSGKQNIVEGTADGVTSLELELNLLNVSRASIQELKEDYLDYLCTRKLSIWDRKHPRYSPMLQFCRTHNQPADFITLFPKYNDEELANLAITLSHQIDSLMQAYMNRIINALPKSTGTNTYPRFKN